MLPFFMSTELLLLPSTNVSSSSPYEDAIITVVIVVPIFLLVLVDSFNPATVGGCIIGIVVVIVAELVNLGRERDGVDRLAGKVRTCNE